VSADATQDYIIQSAAEKCGIELIKGDAFGGSLSSLTSRFEVKLYRTDLSIITKYPDLLITFNYSVNSNMFKHVNQLGLPIIGLTDSEFDCQKILYPIPVNNKSSNTIYFFANFFANLILKEKLKSSNTLFFKRYSPQIEESRKKKLFFKE
jgi:ribosomal protein S2